MVIKADGLAAGKGVVIAENEADAKKAVEEMMGARIFGDAGDKVCLLYTSQMMSIKYPELREAIKAYKKRMEEEITALDCEFRKDNKK